VVNIYGRAIPLPATPSIAEDGGNCAPGGQRLHTEFDAADAVLTCRVNGQMRQMASTRDMVFNVPTLIAYVSSVMTLEPGDLIFTGTPAGVGELKNGDEVVVEIEGLGVLRNPVRKE